MPVDDIFSRLSKDMSVLRGTQEDVDAWRRRLIYSALGKLALASVWDNEEGLPSVQHFLKSIAERQPYYLQILGAAADYLEDSSLLCDEVYNIYLDAGAFYHKKNHLAPAVSCSASEGEIIFLRGCNPLAAYLMSGLGEYSISPVGTQHYYPSVCDMFHLHRPLMSLARECETDAKWKNANFPDASEFLTMHYTEPEKNVCWSQKPDEDTAFSLMRIPLAVSYNYYLYRKSPNGWQWSQLPAWQTNPITGASNTPEWLALANGILMLNNSLPPVQCVGDMNLMTVSFPYLLPPMEETFFKLYSWPMPNMALNRSPQRVTRQMATPVYRAFKSVMESLGYFFEEEI